MRRHAIVISVVFLLVACASAPQPANRSIALQVVPLETPPEIHGYALNDINYDLSNAIVHDFETNIGQVRLMDYPGALPFVSLTITQEADARSRGVVRVAGQAPIIWFGILFRVKTLDGTRTGYVAAYGPDPSDNEHFQQARREVVDRAVLQLRQAIATALSKRS